MSAQFYQTCERILSATANGVYQGILVALLAGLALRWVVRTNAATRHAVWMGVLLFAAGLIPAHILLACRTPASFPPATITAPAETSLPPAAPSQPSDLSAPSDPPTAPITETPSAEATPLPLPAPPTPALTNPPPTPQQPWWTSLQPVLRTFTQPIRLPHWASVSLLAAWILLAGVRAATMLFHLRQVRRCKADAEAPGPNLQAIFDRLCESLPSRRRAHLKISREPSTAMLLGFVHPVILLPKDMDEGADPGEVEHVLRHELAHVARRDDWSNLAQQLVQAALFFHPAVWWISLRLSLEREIACDDHVLAASARPRAYALTLANVAARLKLSRNLLAPGVSDNNSQLQERITMILNTQRDRSPRLAKAWLGVFTSATGLLAAAAIIAGPRLVLAQPLQDNQTPPAPATPVVPAATPALPQPGWGTVESGPRIKPDTGVIASSPDQPSAPGALPSPPLAPPAEIRQGEPRPHAVHAPRVEGRLFSLAQAPEAEAAVPAPPPPPGATSESPLPPRRLSIQDRLDRIERVLDELEARDGLKPHNLAGNSSSTFGRGAGQSMASVSVTPSPSVGVTISTQAGPNSSAAVRAARSAANAAQQAKQAAEQAVAADQRAAQASQRASEQALREMAEDDYRLRPRAEDYRQALKSASNTELDALRSAHDSLQAELKNLEHQIQQLEKSQDRVKKSADPANSNGNSSDDMPSLKTR